MSWLDPTTMSLVTALVVIVCAIIFLADTVSYATSLAARVWALSFMAGILTVLSYMAWEFLPDGWIPAAVGNAAFVTTTGCMWAGARVYNEQPLAPAGVTVGLASGGTLVVTLAAGPGGGAWAGAEVMFVSLGVLAALGSVESRRGPLSTRAPSYGLTIALGGQCLYYIARTSVFVAYGPQSPVFLEWFDTAPTSLITITFTITVVVSITVLRANERARPSTLPDVKLSHGRDGFLEQASFERVMAGQLQRAEQRGEHLAVIALQIHDLPQIRTAFGTRTARRLATHWRAGIQEAVPLGAFLGQCRAETALIGVPVLGEAQAKQLAGQYAQRTLDELTSADTTIIPVLGVGLAVSGAGGQAADLVAAAEEAANRSALSLDATVILAEPLQQPPHTEQ